MTDREPEKTEIVAIADMLFLKCPYDPPEKIFELAQKYVECREKFVSGTLVPETVIDPIPKV